MLQNTEITLSKQLEQEESQKWRSHGGLSVGRERMWGESTGNKKHNRWAQNRQREVRKSIGNGEAKQLYV